MLWCVYLMIKLVASQWEKLVEVTSQPNYNIERHIGVLEDQLNMANNNKKK